MPIEIKEISYKNFGKCLKISNGKIELIVSIDMGPRILSFALNGGENVLFNDIHRKYKEDNEAIKNYYGEDKVRYRYGGHKIITTPEIMPDSFYPDNKPVTYSIKNNSVTLEQEEQDKNKISIAVEIIMSETIENVMIVHSVKNLAKSQINLGLSASTDVRSGGTLLIPQNKKYLSEFSPNRSYALWPYSKVNDSRLFMGEDFISIKQDESKRDKFKLGVNNYSNWAAYFCCDNIFVKNYVHNIGAKYPDFNSSFEVFTDENLLEIRTLSPLSLLNPLEVSKHVENWSIYSCDEKIDFKDEKQIQAVIDKY